MYVIYTKIKKMERKTIKDRTIEFIKSQRLKTKEFEQICGLSTGYISTMRRGFGSDKLLKVLQAFPELNRDWLVFGEGEMLKTKNALRDMNKVQETHIHDNNTVQQTNTLNIDTTLVNELSKAHEIATKAQEHVDKLLALIDKMTEKK